ncbi:MAG: thioredoxin-disulfide reductase [Armatimonadetes bacterium]|nr:thioredoxin-disulfide reductase [Armatimonadota bacterium]
MREHELVIIGGGVAGLTAGIYGARYGLDLVLLSAGGPGGQIAMTSHIENFPGFPDGITGPEFVMRVSQQAQNFDVTIENATVDRVESADGRWHLICGDQTFSTLTTIIATGASPRRLQIPGEAKLFGRGVSTCATCDGFFYRGKTVAVVGGGNTAAEDALYLADITEKVYLIHRRDQLRADPILAERVLAQEKIEVIWDTIPIAINGETQLESVTLHNKKTEEDSELPLDGLFLAIGHEPNTGFLGNLVKLEDGFIVVNMRMETSQPGIFAAGDVRNTPLRQLVTAVGDAAIAATSAYQYVCERR